MNLGNTGLVEIKAHDFKYNQNLEYLCLEKNKLNSIPFDIFTKLTKLKLLFLGDNQLEELPNVLFTNNINLEKIDLINNKIKFLDSSSFDGLSKLNFVELNNNICINNTYNEPMRMIQLKIDIKIKCNYPEVISVLRTELLKTRDELQTKRNQVKKLTEQLRREKEITNRCFKI